MVKKILTTKISILYSLFIIMGFAVIRFYESTLFYDPLLAYYKNNFQELQLPTFDNFKIAIYFILRYFMNTFLSLLLLWTLFKDMDMLRFSAYLYVFLLIFLLLSFFIVLYFYNNQAKMILFYIRRFIIQPIFILIFLPGFWYQKKLDS